MKPWLAALLLLALLALPGMVQAQESVSMLESSVDYLFGQSVTFEAVLRSDVPVESALIFFQAQGDSTTQVEETQVSALDERDTYKLEYVHPISTYTLRAFANIEYRYEVTLEDGSLYKSPSYSFFYSDNRFKWRTLEEAPFIVHWYEGDVAFAQSVLDTAQEGLTRLQGMLPLPVPPTVDIYIYPDSRTLQSVLLPSAKNWVAGHADPDLGMILASLPQGPEQRLLTEQRIPHELMHIVLYQATDLGYENIPTWLNEGLASLVELYPSADYRVLLESAMEKDSLLPVSSLCFTFPRDASSALLSYAQSASFVAYIHQSYGTDGLQELISAYANGLDCEQGARKALGIGLQQLERNWRRDALAQNVALTSLQNLLPWLLILGAVLAAPISLIVVRLRSPKHASKN
jgi:hypothetical protein